MNLQARIKAAENWINQRALSERRLLSAVFVILIGSIWFTLVQRPSLIALEASGAQILESQRQARVMQTTFDELRTALEANPVLTQRSRLRLLQAEIERLHEKLSAQAVSIISPRQMVAALRDLLERQNGLTLIELENLPVEPAFANAEQDPEATATDASAAKSTAAPVIYRHRVRLALRGEYLAVLGYLDALEALPWRFQWDDFNIEMDQYPQADVVIYLNTLSLGRNWIGT